jgi:cytochrome b
MTMNPTDDARPSTRVRVWDIPTRLFHWTLVFCIASAWVSFRYSDVIGDDTMRWHRWNGYTILVLLVFRLIWGFAGSSTSRWSAFVRWPWTAAQYALDLARGRDRHFLGHNPAGTYMVLGLLGVVALQAGLGLFTVEHNDTGADGPLYLLVTEATYVKLSKWHVWVFYYMLLPLIGLHIVANTLYAFVKKDPLIRAMVTGDKPAGDYEDASEASIARNVLLRAITCLIAAIAIVFGGILLAGGRLFS